MFEVFSCITNAILYTREIYRNEKYYKCLQFNVLANTTL